MAIQTAETIAVTAGRPELESAGPRNGDRRRAELADFLRKRRAALTPEDVGLPGGGRRRTPGLRREEVAMLSGVGTTWYTWLEQGRDVRASHEVLDAIANALHMTGAERTHLLLLGRGEEPPYSPLCAEQVSPTLRRLIESLGANPAYLIGRRWDYLAWNDAAVALLGDFETGPEHLRNHLWLTFMNPARRTLFTDWPEMSRVMVAKFRATHAHNLGDPAFEQLLDALRRSSPEFCRAWKRHEVETHHEGRKILEHPVAGRLTFEHAVLHPQSDPDQRLILYTPVCGDGTADRFSELMAAVAPVATA